MLFPYPMPDVLGLSFDPTTRATISKVGPGSEGARLGLRPGDQVVSLGSQPITSVADMQWVLHRLPAAGAGLEGEIAKADGGRATVEFKLPAGWRQGGDISWRVSTWDLRRQAFGGIRFKPVAAEERARLGLGGALALRAEHVGQYGDHARAKRAGVRKGDVLVEFDGLRTDLSEGRLIAHIVQRRDPGYRLPVKVLRGGKEIGFAIQLP